MSSLAGHGVSPHPSRGFAIASLVFGIIALVYAVLGLVALIGWDFTQTQYMSQGWAFLFWTSAVAAIPLGSFLAVIFGLTGLHRPDGHRDRLAVAGVVMGAVVAVCLVVVLSGGFLNG